MSGDSDADASRMPTARTAASGPFASADSTRALRQYESADSFRRSAGPMPTSEPTEFGRELIHARFPDASWTENEACGCLDHPIDAELTDFLEGDELFFDVETLGFHGRQLFLVGAIVREGSSWWTRQLLARDYTEEEAVLADFAELASTRSMWISFNGKAFDAPFLRSRAAYYRRQLPEPEVHLDLLHGARRVYRKLLPDCRLQTLEARIFGRYRVRDLPGREVPSAYHEYVRTGRADDLIRILRHNRDDLQSLIRLHRHLLEP
jgi:uncharacterized protein YprB with RNaseH-like and TPR domain